jgi:hypothetical protein
MGELSLATGEIFPRAWVIFALYWWLLPDIPVWQFAMFTS